MKPELIILSSSFPIGQKEPFLETEYKYLKNSFARIHFIVNYTENVSQKLKTHLDPDSITTLKTSKQKDYTKILTSILNPTTFKEIYNILKNSEPKHWLMSIKIAIISYNNAKLISKKIQEIITEKSLNNVLLYSYWADDSAVAIAMTENPSIISKITRTHGWDLYPKVHQTPYLPYRTLIQRKLNYIFPISSKGIEIIKEDWKVPTTNVQTMRLGVPSRNLTNQKKSNQFTIVSCSNIIPLKRVDFIAKAIMSLTLPVQWFHFGSGKEQFKIEEIIASNTIHKIELKGHISNDDLIMFYEKTKIDLFINCSTTEGIPVSIMEAMSMGIPVIATNVGGTSEIVNNENGILLSANPSPQEIAAAITSFYEMSDDEYAYYSNNAYQTWDEKYNAEKNYKAFIKLIQN